ncbi:hypothetical protein [Paracoccus shandongensis]|uniref:hypothetical protein n=1 Tax=Paracoccus shandongensis TaxID=2816048 RepID=UPI001A9075AB|nr:hypothetical protein [Paracoccus shandongensis]
MIRLNGKAGAVVLYAFLAVWLAGMTAALSAGACRDQDRTPGRRLAYCNITIMVGSVFPGEGPKRSMLFLERGIVLARLGRIDDARADMTEAIQRAARKEFSDDLADLLDQARSEELPRVGDRWIVRLLARAEKEQDKRVREAWQATIEEYAGQAR